SPLRSISATRRSASLRIDSFWKSFFNCSRLLTWAAERSSFSRLRRIKAISGRSSLFMVPEPKYSPQRPSHSRNSRPRSSKPCANCWSIAGFVPSNAPANLGEDTKGSESKNPKSHRLTIRNLLTMLSRELEPQGHSMSIPQQGICPCALFRCQNSCPREHVQGLLSHF